MAGAASRLTKPPSSRPSRRPSLPLPLLTWRDTQAIEAERAALLARIARLKPRSHARIIAENDLRALTTRALAIETTPPTLPPSNSR